jgi:hypothetical protein
MAAKLNVYWWECTATEGYLFHYREMENGFRVCQIEEFYIQ